MAESTETGNQLKQYLDDGGVTYLLVKGKDGAVEKKNLEDCDFLKGHCAMYFSGHWCGPCRSFTPNLAKRYTETDMGLTIIFMTKDRTESDFNKYYAEMPWVAIPYEFKDALRRSDAFEEPAGIPSLYLFDDKGKLYSTNGRGNISSKPFPYADPSFSEILASVVELDENDELVPVDQDALRSKTYFVLYFSAHWCPPCRQFTPHFSGWYPKVKAKRDDFEVIFMSRDSDKATMKNYFKTMTFKAFDIFGGDASKRKQLDSFFSSKYGVRGIPAVVVVDKEGNVLCKNAREGIMKDTEGTGEGFPLYIPDAVQNLAESLENINTKPSIIIFCERQDAERQAQLEELLRPHGEEQRGLALKREVMHFISKTIKGNEIAGRIRGIMGKDEDFNGMVMLDVQNSCFYVKPLPDLLEDVVNFHNEFKENVLEADQFRRVR